MQCEFVHVYVLPHSSNVQRHSHIYVFEWACAFNELLLEYEENDMGTNNYGPYCIYFWTENQQFLIH